jgi:hypothetical protein
VQNSFIFSIELQIKKENESEGNPARTLHTPNPSASFLVMLFASFPSCSTWPGRTDQPMNQSQSKSCILTRRQKITPIKLAPSYFT